MQGMSYEEYQRLRKGGPGSGNFDHEGRPGEVGGSAPDASSGPGLGAALGKTAAQLGGNLAGTVAGWEIGRHFTPQIIAGIGRALGLSNNRVMVLAKVATRIPVLRDILSYAAASTGAAIGSPVVGSLARSMYEYLTEKGVTENTPDAVLAKLDFSDAPKPLLSLQKSYQGDDLEAEDMQKGGPGSGFFGHDGRLGEVGGSVQADGSNAPKVPTGQANGIAEMAADAAGSYAGYGIGKMADVAAGQALKRLLPVGVKTVLTAAATRLPLAASILGFMTPGGIAGSLIGGAVAQVGVSLLLDWLEEKGVESPEDLAQLSPNDLADAPTVEDAKALATQEPLHEYPIQKGSSDSGFWGHSGQKGRHGGSAYSLGKPPAPGIQLKQQQLAESARMGEKKLNYNEYRRRKRLAEGWVYDEYGDEWVWQDGQGEEPYSEETPSEPYTPEPPAEEPQTYNIDQYDDTSQYAEAPTATDVPTKPTPSWLKRTSDWLSQADFGSPHVKTPEEAKAEQQGKTEKKRSQEEQLAVEAGVNPLFYGKDVQYNPDQTITVTDRKGNKQNFANYEQAQAFYRGQKDVAAEKPPEKTTWENLMALPGAVYKAGTELYRGIAPEFLGGTSTEPRPYDTNDPNAPKPPASMPPYTVSQFGYATVYNPDGTTSAFRDPQAAFAYYSGSKEPGDQPLAQAGTPAEEPLPPTRQGSTLRQQYQLPSNVARYEDLAATGAPLSPERERAFEQARMSGQTISLPSLPKREYTPSEQAAREEQAQKLYDAALPENIRRDQLKRQQEERDARAQEIAAQQRERENERQQLEHEQLMQRLRRQSPAFGAPPDVSPTTPVSYGQYRQARDEGGAPSATRPQPSTRAERPSSESGSRQGFMSYASKNGLRVRERGGLIYVTDASGRQLSFDSYDKAMRYYQQGKSAPQYVQSVQKDAAPTAGLATLEYPPAGRGSIPPATQGVLEDDCARIGAECMRGERSGRITIVIPNRFAQQFASEEEARIWLNENIPNVGA
jgi:hypothetical protein